MGTLSYSVNGGWQEGGRARPPQPEPLTGGNRGPRRITGDAAVPSKKPSVAINLHFCVLIRYLVGHDPMGRNLLWDIEKLCSHAPRVGAGEPGAAAATRCVEGA